MSTNLTSIDDKLLQISDQEWWEHKAQFCTSLYKQGLQHAPWTDERAELWLASLRFFVDEFFVPELPVPHFHEDWYRWSVSERAYLNLSPRDHAKTTIHSVIRPVWEICVNRNITFFIIFSTTDVAKLILAQIKSQLTQNPRIIAGFGSFNPETVPKDERMVDQDWSQHSITVNRSDYTIKDPTVAVAGSLTNVLSRRVDRLIVDDLLTDKIAYSDAESERLERWYFNDVQPVLKADGQEIITGTRYRNGDFYDYIVSMSKEKDGLYRVFVGDAVIDEEKEEVLWPERWSWESLMRQRAKMGSVRFNRNYRNIIISDEDSPFPMIWFKGGVDKRTGHHYVGCFDPHLTLGGSPPGTTPSSWLRHIVIGVDPAIGLSKRSKFFAVVVMGISPDKRIVVSEIVRTQLNHPAQKRLVLQLNQRYKPRYVVVESNAYQKALAEGLEEMMANIHIMPIFTSRRTPPELGVPAMDIWFETGRVRLPYGDDRSRKMSDAIAAELHHWGKYSTSDLGMAFWFAFERLKPELERSGIMPSLQNMLFGDRHIYERQLVSGLAGSPLPRRARQMVRERVMNEEVAKLMPFLKRDRKKILRDIL